MARDVLSARGGEVAVARILRHEVPHGRTEQLVLPAALRERVPDVITGGWSYIRFHQGQPSKADYTRDKLRRWADRIAEMPAKDVFVYFNNDPGGAAVRDAVTLTEMLAERGCDLARPRVHPSSR